MTWAGRIHFREGLSGRTPFQVNGACVDITESKRAEAALRESEERFRGFFEYAITGIGITDMSGVYLSCNPAYSKMLGYSPEELRNLPFPSFVHPDDRNANVELMDKLAAEEIPFFEVVNRYIRKDGRSLWVHKNVSLLRDAAGKPTHVLVLATDINEQKLHEEQIGFLMQEVNHRSKNLLSLVLAIARQTGANGSPDFLERFGERIRALAASQDLLVKNTWKGVDLAELISAQLAHFQDLLGTRIKLEGPPVFLSPQTAQALGMAVHELATNAGKYGALSSKGGSVSIAWGHERSDSGNEIFSLSWREHCTNPITPPSKQGFGSSVICDMTEWSLKGKVELDYSRFGLSWRLRCPTSELNKSRSLSSP